METPFQTAFDALNFHKTTEKRWHRGVAVECRTRYQEVVKTLGKFLTPMCLCHQAV